MSLRVHAAVWMAAVAMAWLLVDPGTLSPSKAAVVGDPDPVRHVYPALLELHVARIHGNVWRTVARLRWLAEAMPGWVPIVVAGILDGIAARCARRCGLAAAPDLARLLSRHVLLALACVPGLWASLDLPAPAWAVAAWAIALSASLSFAISRVQGLGDPP